MTYDHTDALRSPMLTPSRWGMSPNEITRFVEEAGRNDVCTCHACVTASVLTGRPYA